MPGQRRLAWFSVRSDDPSTSRVPSGWGATANAESNEQEIRTPLAHIGPVVSGRPRGSFAYITGVLPGGEQSSRSGSATAARLTPSASRSTHPPATATKTLSRSPGCPSAARKKHSTPPAPSTSQRSDTNPNPDPDELTASPTTDQVGQACLVAGEVLPAVVEVVLVAVGDHHSGEGGQDAELPE